MKIFREAILLLTIYFIGEVISKTLNLPIPSNILGMILLFILLTSNVIKLKNIENLSNFFLSHLSFFFIPSSVGLMKSFIVIKSNIIQIIFLCILTTIIAIASTSLTIELIYKKKNNKKEC